MIGVREIWQALRALPSVGGGWKSQRVLGGAPCPVRVAIGEPGGEAALLLEVSSHAVEGAVEYPQAKGFRLSPEPIRPGPHGETRLCLVLADEAYREVFAVLAEDIADAVGSTTSHADAVAKLLARLRVWQAFMRRGTEGLTQEEQTGLLAELLFLAELLIAGMAPATAAMGWVGARAGLRDFAFGACEIEIKAGTGSAAGRFYVSHIDQLDETTVGSLLLAHYALAEGIAGSTLPEIVATVRDALAADPTARTIFEDSLLFAGYTDLHSGLYDSRHLTVRRRRIFRIADDFPRIIRSEVRPGILDMGYSVDLQSCLAHEIPTEEAMRIARGTGVADV